MKHVRPYLGFLLAGAALFAGCGADETAPSASSSLRGPPEWRLTTLGTSETETRCTLKMRTPGRIRFRFESHGGISHPSVWRTVAGGQTVTVLWSYNALPRETILEAAGPEDAAAGRTEPHGFAAQFGFGDRVRSNERFIAFARPASGKALVRSLLPPGTYEALPDTASLELLTLVVADVAAGEVRLRTRELQGVVRLPATMTPEDRTAEARVFLDIEPVDAGQ